MKEWLFRWSPAIIIMGIIFIASATSGSSIPNFGYINFLVMKGGHLSGYALLGAAFLHGLSNGGAITRSRVVITGILVVLYATSDEWHQNFTPGRHPSPWTYVSILPEALLEWHACTLPGRGF